MKWATRVFLLGGFTAISLLITGCTTTDTGRRQLKLVSNEQEMQLGLTAFEEMKKETPISRNARDNDLVRRVGERIARQAQSRLPNAQWEFVVFDSPEMNAFCLPGGKVGVYSGILAVTQTEAGLATVIGHEVAHASQNHGAERMSEALVLQGVGSALGAVTPDKYQNATLMAYGLGAKVGRELPHGRKQESEADHVGLLYMARAGYDPREALKFWERFAAVTESKGGSTPWFLRTHPVTKDRIANLQQLMPGAVAEYEKSKRAGGAPESPLGVGAPTRGSGRNQGSTVIGR